MTARLREAIDDFRRRESLVGIALMAAAAQVKINAVRLRVLRDFSLSGIFGFAASRAALRQGPQASLASAG
ncbi:hypothetical protein [Oceanibacterium hippocampi]|uniref:Uncharacterized protein n=1 Tax=Oceanibacterium hippocampi TaxID=745714 RepID=A0A1Y5TYE2_9PROT|nr:hypothetical protein [Oceanibacterium hippocampi]SLN76603.1 hypothetical protein OCH7691_04145 [Oceanibacterium hippocampi]